MVEDVGTVIGVGLIVLISAAGADETVGTISVDLHDGTMMEFVWIQPGLLSMGSPKLPNPWGLYDIYGNVWEWVQDWYSPYYAAGRQVDPTGPAAGTARVMRGGGFVNHARNVRSAKRYSYDPSLRFSDLGARLVRMRK